ncbi:hypothetical protein GWK47_041870 [Chionoecetes opilio]|uniref:DUF4789 domain-containing protein n=1 Tax=Chionoecetes opilio TaxID=41210 RepID=A0A8J4YNJ8_CHIOP|nr:hypothetical protein GWK47_041870 [Chionoecetes opilio]
MSTFLLTLLVVCCAARGVYSAATPLWLMADYDSELHSDILSAAASSKPSQRGKLHRSLSFHLPTFEPEQPALERLSDAAGKTLVDTRHIILPRETGDYGSGDPGVIASPGDAALKKVLFPSGFKGDFEPIEPASSCMVSRNLTVSHNKKSWKLLTRGQCPEGEWAVIVAECQPACRPQPCLQGELEYEGRCVSPSDPTVCSEEQILYITLRGTIYCDCEQDHFYHAWSSACLARRYRGPCDFGFILEINQDGNVECMANDCQSDTYEKDPTSGKCFRKDFVGYCPLDTLQFNSMDQTVGCPIIYVRAALDRAITRSCTRGSRIDHSGNCRQELVVPSLISMPRSLTDGCPDGAIRAQTGSCRRVNGFI